MPNHERPRDKYTGLEEDTYRRLEDLVQNRIGREYCPAQVLGVLELCCTQLREAIGTPSYYELLKEKEDTPNAES